MEKKPQNNNVGQLLVCSTFQPGSQHMEGTRYWCEQYRTTFAPSTAYTTRFVICSDKIETALVYPVPAHGVGVCIWKLPERSCSQLWYENLHSESFGKHSRCNSHKGWEISSAQSRDLLCTHTKLSKDSQPFQQINTSLAASLSTL